MFTHCWVSGMLPSDLMMQLNWDQLEPTYPMASEKQSNSTQKRLLISLEMHTACGRESKPSLITNVHHGPVTAMCLCWSNFFARSEAVKSMPAQKTQSPTSEQVLRLSSASVKKSLSIINPAKQSRWSRQYSWLSNERLCRWAQGCTDIFNMSMSQGVFPTCFKTTIIIHVPKKTLSSCLDDYYPVALTSTIMKCWIEYTHNSQLRLYDI